MATTNPCQYTHGPTSPRTLGYASYETKAGDDSGAGYCRWRSWEWRPHTPRQSKEDVYVPVHRLLAVIECYPIDTPIADVLEDLDGKDVHHTTGIKWLNFGESPNFDTPGIRVIGHGKHSSVTNAEIRAFAEDDKERATTDTQPDRCESCGSETETFLESPDWDGQVCIECSKRLSDGATIRVV